MEKKPHSFCETPEENCTMNYCDDNGCQNRKRELVNPLDNLTPDEMAIDSMNSELTQLKAENERLKAALEQISNPIKFMQNNLKEGEKLDGFYAIQLSQSASYLKDIAKEALESLTHKER
jgi:hypothetical protein